MRILGVDPGTAITGVAVVDMEGYRLELLHYDVIRTPADEVLPMRLVTIHEALCRLLDSFRPEAVAVERLFFNKNVQSAMSVGQARGVVLLAAGSRRLPVMEYTPSQVKSAVTGHGSASKEQVQLMIQSLLQMQTIPTPDDAADAIAVAVCGLHRWGWDRRLEAGR